MSKAKKFILAIPFGIPSILMILIVAYLSLWPNPIPILKVEFVWWDKLAHVLLYFVATCVFILDYAKSKLPHHINTEKMLAFTAASIVLGAVMEVGQLVSKLGRMFDVLDIVANTIGAILAFLFIKFWYMHKFRKTFYYSLHKSRHHYHRYINEKAAKAKVAEQQEELKQRIQKLAGKQD